MDAWNGLGQTPLFVAAYLKKYETVSMLLNLGADPNVIFFKFYSMSEGLITKLYCSFFVLFFLGNLCWGVHCRPCCVLFGIPTDFVINTKIWRGSYNP